MYARMNQTVCPLNVDLFTPYRAKLAVGWQADAAQARAVVRLQALSNALLGNTAQPPKGVWLHGPPGRGKSAILELFIQNLPQGVMARRVHFHAFMEELHRRMNAMPPKPGTDYVAQLATDIASEATVIGFDEFYLTNLPDAMLLGRLMHHLFQRGVVVVATSNWPLEELFQGGLNRDRFLPLLNLMRNNLDVLPLTLGLDYRQREGKTAWGHYICTPVGESDVAQLEGWWHEVSEGPHAKAPKWLQAKRTAGRAVWLTFAQACGQNLGRTEYRELANTYSTILLEGVPVLGATDADAALRLATLVDILYDQKRQLIMSAAALPQELCTTGAAAEVFQRTASRLAELS
jgi:cell division protein ZapE